MSKEIHIWFDDYPRGTCHTIEDTLIDLTQSGLDVVHTTQPSFASTKFLVIGIRIFIHPYSGDEFELTLGNCANTDREIRPAHNLEKMIFN